MATKIAVAQTRMFANVFVCKNCSKKMRTQAVRIIAHKVRCPRCNSHDIRPIRKK